MLRNFVVSNTHQGSHTSLKVLESIWIS